MEGHLDGKYKVLLLMAGPMMQEFLNHTDMLKQG